MSTPDQQPPQKSEHSGQEPPPESLTRKEIPLRDTLTVEASADAKQLLEACPSCKALMDVTDHEPFAKVSCPSCGETLRARKQFNHYTLLELIGTGGMGNVFKARDCNLNRLVALKVLKKELASSPEERAKLEVESQITASVTHPHVVKVFSFGQDHGQFYMAMELIERGSLDDLMALQKRVSEAQVLEVGVQVAQGLDAALEHELIHRDIKPGNILFADPHTVKLVDFGLAIVLDEAAAVAGEIWGTPYYIAPEKLDNQPEDFRSDVYSLGATLFHALAGRPPYEADTASMVALKQLKSQPVSIQTFAPGVSSETAYVINRMLAKAAEDRYDSYEELVEHMQYARNKLIERTKQPPKPKARVVIETKESRNFTAIISVLLFIAMLGACGLLYAFRDSILPRDELVPVASMNSDDFTQMLAPAIEAMDEGRFDEARAAFLQASEQPDMEQPFLNWMRVNAALACLAMGKNDVANELYNTVYAEGLYSESQDDLPLADFFVETSRLLKDRERPITTSIGKPYVGKEDFSPFALFAFGLFDWMQGEISLARQYMEEFLNSEPKGPYSWIRGYRGLANRILSDAKQLETLQTKLGQAASPGEREKVAAEIESVRLKMKSGELSQAALGNLRQQAQP